MAGPLQGILLPVTWSSGGSFPTTTGTEISLPVMCSSGRPPPHHFFITSTNPLQGTSLPVTWCSAGPFLPAWRHWSFCQSPGLTADLLPITSLSPLQAIFRDLVASHLVQWQVPSHTTASFTRHFPTFPASMELFQSSTRDNHL